jgi:hypothetical protein
MERLIVNATEYTPAIDCDPSTLTMQFKGISRPENVGLFYQQVIDWIDGLKQEVTNKYRKTITLTFKFGYCNSATQKYILIILEKLVDMKALGLDINVNWLCLKGDEKMLEDGEDISDAIGIDFNFEFF